MCGGATFYLPVARLSTYFSNVHTDLGLRTPWLATALAALDMAWDLGPASMVPVRAAAKGHLMRSAVWTQWKTGSRQNQFIKLHWEMQTGGSLRPLASFLAQLTLHPQHRPAILVPHLKAVGPLSAACSPVAFIGSVSDPSSLHA